MRKQYHSKRRSCGLCNPHKKGWQNRWTVRDHTLIVEFEADRASYLRGASYREQTDTVAPLYHGNAFVFDSLYPSTWHDFATEDSTAAYYRREDAYHAQLEMSEWT